MSASSNVTSGNPESLFAVDLSLAANGVGEEEGLDEVDLLPDESLSGGKARSQSMGMASGIGLVAAMPSVAGLIESLRILLVDNSVLCRD